MGRQENAIGWYHSHPGYGCWLSGIDVSTQMLNQNFQVSFYKTCSKQVSGLWYKTVHYQPKISGKIRKMQKKSTTEAQAYHNG